MEGISDKWISLDNQHFVHFTNLPAGKYKFHAKGSNSDGIWNETPASLNIIIYPPWWKSTTAYIFYLVFIILLVLIIVKRRERAMIYEKKILENEVSNRTTEIALQKNKLYELNATKDKFFSILAHDLKNPFASLYSLSNLLKDNYETADEEDKIMIIEKISSSAKHIYSLLESLLTWSRSQSGFIKYTPVEFDISRLVNANLNLNQVQAEKKGIKLLNSTNGKLNVFADQEMINTIIRNLINNAVKYTNKGGTIEVKVHSSNDYLEVSVCDQGIGISQEDQKKLFQIDVKYKTPGTSNEMGTGLGLILCREFIEKNRGKIWVESELGKGSCFYFTLPNKKGGG